MKEKIIYSKYLGTHALTVLLFASLFFSCGLADESLPPAPANSACANRISVGKMTVSPATVDYPLLSTIGNGLGAPFKITISGGYAPYQITSASFVSLSKTKAIAVLPPNSILLEEVDAVPIITDPSCTTYEFYLQPNLGANPSAGSFADIVTVRDRNGDTVELPVTVTVAAPA